VGLALLIELRVGHLVIKVGSGLRHEGVYTLVSPGLEEDMQFLGRVVPSSAVWRHMVAELRAWLERTNRKGRGTVGFRISLRATIVGGSVERMAESVAAVAEHLDDIQQHTPAFLGFTLSSDRKARTALFNMYVDEDDPEDAVSAAHSWATTAIIAVGDGTRGWQTYAHPEERERVPA